MIDGNARGDRRYHRKIVQLMVKLSEQQHRSLEKQRIKRQTGMSDRNEEGETASK